jgi:hypothetical protein
MTGLPRKASSEPDLRGWTFRFLGARRRAEPIKPPSVSTGAVL